MPTQGRQRPARRRPESSTAGTCGVVPVGGNAPGSGRTSRGSPAPHSGAANSRKLKAMSHKPQLLGVEPAAEEHRPDKPHQPLHHASAPTGSARYRPACRSAAGSAWRGIRGCRRRGTWCGSGAGIRDRGVATAEHGHRGRARSSVFEISAWPAAPPPTSGSASSRSLPLVHESRRAEFSRVHRDPVLQSDHVVVGGDALQMEGVVAGEVETAVGRAHARVARRLGQRERRRVKVVVLSVRERRNSGWAGLGPLPIPPWPSPLRSAAGAGR